MLNYQKPMKMNQYEKLLLEQRRDIEQYEYFIKVEENDTILDLGCSKGYFYFKHLGEKINYVGVDASLDCLREFINNCESDIPLLLNCFIDDNRKGIIKYQSIFEPYNENYCSVVSFKQLMRGINRIIDFLKFDIESYEYTFWSTEENVEFFIKNVRKFSGEVHFLGDVYTRQNLIDCLNKIKLDRRIFFKLFSIDGVEITTSFQERSDYYNEIIISGYNMPETYGINFEPKKW